MPACSPHPRGRGQTGRRERFMGARGGSGLRDPDRRPQRLNSRACPTVHAVNICSNRTGARPWVSPLMHLCHWAVAAGRPEPFRGEVPTEIIGCAHCTTRQRNGVLALLDNQDPPGGARSRGCQGLLDRTKIWRELEPGGSVGATGGRPRSSLRVEIVGLML